VSGGDTSPEPGTTARSDSATLRPGGRAWAKQRSHLLDHRTQRAGRRRAPPGRMNGYNTQMNLEAEIMAVLRSVAARSQTASVTAYQILGRLPSAHLLVARYGLPGRGCGKHFSAASAVANVLAGMRAVVEVQYLDTLGLRGDVLGANFAAGVRVCGAYRLR